MSSKNYKQIGFFMIMLIAYIVIKTPTSAGQRQLALASANYRKSIFCDGQRKLALDSDN